MNANTSLFVICVGVMIYLLLYNLYDCAFNTEKYSLMIKLHTTSNLASHQFHKSP